MKRLLRNWPLLLIVLLCVVSRLPQLLSKELLLDGDECVIGIMAKHFIEGKEIPIFFHGQAYGFSFIETALVSLCYLIWGMSDLCVKVPMLLMWTGGVLFFYKALTTLDTKYKWLPFLIILVFIFSPSWAVWSMKARGGYLTAFFFSSVLLWISLRKSQVWSYFNYFLIGVMLVLIYQSQPLWLPGLLPVMVYRFYPFLNWRRGWSIVAGILPFSLLFLVLKMSVPNHWSPKVFTFTLATVVHDLQDLPALLYDHFNGYYYLYYIYKAPAICNVFACLLIALIIFLVIVAILSIRRHQHNALYLVAVSAVVCTIGYTLFLTEHAPRYLIPLTACVMLALFVYLGSVRHWSVPVIICLVFILIGIPSVITFKDYTFFPARRIEVTTSVDYLQKHDIHYCFSNDGLLQWQIMFYSHESVICRESDTEDRYPEYVQAVNYAYRHDRQHVAVIDNIKDLKGTDPDSTINVISHFYILLRPRDYVLKDMEYKF